MPFTSWFGSPDVLMPTEPLTRLLDRDLQRVGADPIIQVACPLLREMVNYGTNVFGRCEQSTKQARVQDIPGEGHLAILLLYLHVVEMIDAIEVQLAQSVAVPPILQLRSAFEAYLQLEWIFKDDTRRRVYAYLVYDIRHRIKIYRSLDTSLPEGKQHQAKIAKDKWASTMSFPQVQDLNERIQNLEELLVQEFFDEVNAAYDPKRPWYRLFGGPKNLEQLAQVLKLPVWYDRLYRGASHTMHAVHLMRNLRGGNLRVLRDPQPIPDVACMAIHTGVYATEEILKFYRPGEVVRFWQWHQQEIHERNSWLAQL